jgi:hypothetical protein
MRHLGSVLLSAVLAPVIWALAGIGMIKFAESFGTFDVDWVTLSVGLLALLGAGLCYTPLVLARLSPLGPALVGVALLGMSVWAAVSTRSFVDTVPAKVLGVPAALLEPARFAPLLAVPLLATLLSARRWRRYDRPDSTSQPTPYGTSGPYATPQTATAQTATPPAARLPLSGTGYPPRYATGPSTDSEPTTPIYTSPPTSAPPVPAWPPTAYPPPSAPDSEDTRRLPPSG